MSQTDALNQIKQDALDLKSSLNSLKEHFLELSSEFHKSLNEARALLSNQNSRPPTVNQKEIYQAQKDDMSLKSIGIFRSCFLTKNGTPRQPGICPYARGSLTITCFNNPQHSLDGLSKFSHVWLLFLFHENGDYIPRSKVSPPRLNGEKVGVFASRSPHRPNNVGMSLVKLEGVSGGTLFLSGVDLIDGTPILDVKPYITTYDMPSSTLSAAPWIVNPPTKPLTISFSDKALSVLAQLKYASGENIVLSKRRLRKKNCLRFFRSREELKQSISDIILADPRSIFRKKQGDTTFSFPIDSVDVTVEVKGVFVTVVDIGQTEYVRGLLKRVGS